MTSNRKPTIAISGSSGFIGSALVAYLEVLNYRVLRLVRHTKNLNSNEIYWDPNRSKLDLNQIEDLFALISLGGENIAAKRWSASYKKKLEDSRIIPTKFLATSIAQLKSPPSIWLSASAIGVYGDRGAEELNEDSLTGNGYLPSLVTKWEEASRLTINLKTRVVNLRFGVVVGKGGGALSKMILPFSLGLGAILGDGKNYMSWIGLRDLLRSIHHILNSTSIIGPVNIVTQNPTTNYDFSKTLAAVLGRPCFLKAPAFVLRALLGDMADEALLSSQRVLPKKLLESGFKFEYPELKSALAEEIRR